MKTKAIAPLAFLTVTLLASCGFSDDECLFGETCEPENDPLPVGTTLDCENLDPDKVYLYGTLQEGLSGREALVDPLDPTSFCVGFGGAFHEGIITNDGRYIFEENLNFYRLEQDELVRDFGDPDEPLWVYPSDPLDNDTLFHTTNAGGCGVRLIMINPSNEDIFYSCPNNTIHTETTSPYYYLANDDLLAITPDGAMVVGSTRGLRLVADDMTETELTIPTNVTFTFLDFLATKHYVDPATNNESLWIAVDGFNGGFVRRWSVDLVTLTVTDQGTFTDETSGITGSYSFRMDGNGNLWQTGYYLDSPDVIDVIMQRPIASDGVPSSVVYSEADLNTTVNWSRQDAPEVRMHASRLVTGS